MESNAEQLADKRLSLRMTDDELKRIEELRQALQARLKGEKYGRYVRATLKMVVLEALDALELRWKDLERRR